MMAATASGTAQLVLPTPHLAQLDVLREARRFNVVCCGRRWGKTTLGIDRLIGPAALDHAPVAWFSPTYNGVAGLAETWRELRQILAPITTHKSEEEHRIELLGGGSVAMWSLDSPNSARGRRYARVVLDEAAMVRELQEAWEAVIRPTLADYQGDAWFMSTPKGYNYFKELFDRGMDPAQEDWAAWRMPTSSNPHIAASEIAAAQRDLPAPMFRQEWEASFEALADARFNLEVVGEALVLCRPALAPGTVALPFAVPGPYLSVWALPRPGVAYVAYTDSAEGKGRDYTVTVILEARTLRHVATLRDNVLEPGQHAVIAEQLCRWYNTALWGVERNRGEAVLYIVGQTRYPRVYWHEESAASLQQRIAGVRPTTRLGFPVTEHTRIGLIDDLAEVIEDRTLGSDDAVFWQECRSFVYNERGRPEALEGAHDDCVLAMAGAVRMARQPGAQAVRSTDVGGGGAGRHGNVRGLGPRSRAGVR